jgi:hypothetical protein
MGFIPINGVWGRRNCQLYIHRMVIGAAGAITSQDPAPDSGIVAALNGVASGQYLLTVSGQGGSKTGVRQFLGVKATVQVPTGAGAVAGGLDVALRDNNMDAGTKNNTCVVQFFLPSTLANTDVTSGNTVYLTLTVAS